jgi:sortase B
MKKKWINNILLVLFILLFVFSGYHLVTGVYSQEQQKADQNKVKKVVTDNKVDFEDGAIMPKFTKKAYEELYGINRDFVGYIVWDTNYIEQPIVQTTNNSYYLDVGFFNKWASSGTIFMDYRNSWGDTNIVLYGHNNRYDYDIMFSHLNDIALDRNIYLQNRTFSVFNKDVEYKYEICYSYWFYEKDFEYEYYKKSWNNEQEFNDWISFAKNNNLQETPLDLEYGDSFITLFTCMRGTNGRHRLVVIGKLMEVVEYE